MTDAAALLKKLIAEADRKKWQEELKRQIRGVGLPMPLEQYKFHPDRKYEADFFYKDKGLIVECDGGNWMDKSGHTSGAGYEKDRIRDAEALLLGFITLRLTGNMIKSGVGIVYLERIWRAMK